MRDIRKVVERLLEIVPEDEVEFRAMLQRAATPDPWKSPETYWHIGSLAFHDRFGNDPPTTGWGAEAFDIWMNKDPPEHGAVVDSQLVPERTDWKLFGAIAVLVVLTVVIYLKAR